MPTAALCAIRQVQGGFPFFLFFFLFFFRGGGDYAYLDAYCSHFLTIKAGVNLHFKYESELLVCWTRNPDLHGARRGC